jgi:hypothetical protein
MLDGHVMAQAVARLAPRLPRCGAAPRVKRPVETGLVSLLAKVGARTRARVEALGTARGEDEPDRQVPWKGGVPPPAVDAQAMLAQVIALAQKVEPNAALVEIRFQPHMIKHWAIDVQRGQTIHYELVYACRGTSGEVDVTIGKDGIVVKRRTRDSRCGQAPPVPLRRRDDVVAHPTCSFRRVFERAQQQGLDPSQGMEVIYRRSGDESRWEFNFAKDTGGFVFMKHVDGVTCR